MKIAFVSYEYAGIASGGGIGTYVRGVTDMLAARGHAVEVFTHDGGADGQQTADVRVNVVDADRKRFAEAALTAFAKRHAAAPFDVVEGPEYGADASSIAAAFPHIPLVVKLHTPTFLIDEINRSYVPRWRKARFMIGALRRGHMPKPLGAYDPETDIERAHALGASEITAPSQAIMSLLASRWALPTDRLSHVPYLFVPTRALLDAPVETRTNRITFVGRLEARKGVIELAQAIREVLSRAPAARFRLIGRSLPHPATGEDLQLYMRRVIGSNAAVEFSGAIPYSELPTYLCDTDICVFPSAWEASGFVCKEAMAAARGVIGTTGSGMAEIIEDGRTGRLVPPRNSAALAKAILGMLGDPPGRERLGRAARDFVSRAFAPKIIGPLQEASYFKAMSRSRNSLDASEAFP
jgi:glycosyltransferase involved in cell wall biosynthesis